MSDINSIILVGRITMDCSSKECSNNTILHSFSIANNYYDYASKSNKANFFNITYFSRTDLRKYLVKGQQIAIQGCLRQNNYKVSNGNTKPATIIADSIQLIGANNKDANAHIVNDDTNVDNNNNDDDDVPF